VLLQYALQITSISFFTHLAKKRKAKLPNFDSDSNDVFTARESSMGNSGGTTDVKMSTHSRKSLYLFLVRSSEPVIKNIHKILISSFTMAIYNERSISFFSQ